MSPLSVLLAASVSIAYSAQWKAETEVLGDETSAIGIWNDTIFVLGGWQQSQRLVQYDTRTDTITSNTEQWPTIPTTTDILGYGQFWVQKNEFLYVIPKTGKYGGKYFGVFNLVSKNYSEWNDGPRNFPTSVHIEGCLAEFDDFLFVVGGTNRVEHDKTQIFNVSGNAWLNQTPSLNQARGSSSCIVHPKTKTLYAFGGTCCKCCRLSSIELLSVSDMDNIGQYNWTIYRNITAARASTRAVIYGMDILIIAGSGDNPAQQNYIFHTLDNTVEWGEIMLQSLDNPAVVITENYTVYTFGGRGVSLIQSMQLPMPPTLNPTVDPTTGPTQMPSIPTTNPTFVPSKTPSETPTQGPTNNPTYDPTYDPTRDPTTDPTHDPTYEPTYDPTKDPTSDPTIDPTFDPTFDPTKDPTSDPTTDPTTDPTNDPSFEPTFEPTFVPTVEPTVEPTANPSKTPTEITANPSQSPTFNPTVDPIATQTIVSTDDSDADIGARTEFEYTYMLYAIIGIFFLWFS